MSPVSTLYFHTASLRQRFLADLDDAVQARRLDALEREWLQGAIRNVTEDEADPLRVDRLISEGDVATSFELAAALMLSHASGQRPVVYLQTLAGGIERFEDRSALLSALRSRFAEGDVDASFEYERIETDTFQAQMLAIIDYQADGVGQLTEALQALPSVTEAVTHALAKQLRDTLPDQPVNAETHLLQLVRTAQGADTDEVVIAQPLAEAAYDEYRNVALFEGVQRRFLDAGGLQANAEDSQRFAQALRMAAVKAPEHHQLLLKAFWNRRWQNQRTHRDLAIENFATRFRDALYRRYHEGGFDAAKLEQLRPFLHSVKGSLPVNRGVSFHELAIRVGDHGPLALAGTFVFDFGAATATPSAICWFSPEHTLSELDDLEALSALLSSPAGRERLRPCLALGDQAVLQKSEPIQVSLQPFESESLYAACVDAVLALQSRNLTYVSALMTSPERVSSMVDDALDIRSLLDPRQLHFTAGRWRETGPVNFGAIWRGEASDNGIEGVLQTPVGQTAISNQEESSYGSRIRFLPPSWLERIKALDLRAHDLARIGNGLIQHAEHRLQQYLCVLDSSTVSARDIRVQWLQSAPEDRSDVQAQAIAVSESAQALSMDLVSLLLERVSGHRLDEVAAQARVLRKASGAYGDGPVAHLDAALINHMLDTIAPDFTEQYLQRFKASRRCIWRDGDRQLPPATVAMNLREDILRLDMKVQRRSLVINPESISMIEQVLDRPVRALRAGIGDAVTEVFSVSVVFGNNRSALLSEAMVLLQPQHPDRGVMLWSGVQGWRFAASIDQMQRRLRQHFQHSKREDWLNLLGEHDRSLLRHHLQQPAGNQIRIRLDRVDGHAIEALQQSALSRQEQDLQQLCIRAVRCRFEAELFSRVAQATEIDAQLHRMLDGLSVRIGNRLLAAMLPPWMQRASVRELVRYKEVLERYFMAIQGEEFLFEIPTLHVYARTSLVERLDRDFPNQSLDPDDVTVTLRRYISAFPVPGELPSGVPAAALVKKESLTEYALNRFANVQDAALSASSARYPRVEELLTPDYLRQTVRELDVGARYLALLQEAFTPEDANYHLRYHCFLEQLPPMLLVVALQQKLEGSLSEQAYHFLERVMDMPDGIAREPVGDMHVILSPLQLVADIGMTPDPVQGAYVICPREHGQGPVILYTSYHDEFVFREYPSQAALAGDICRDDKLQKWLLERVEPAARKRYDHGGFLEPHLPFSTEGAGNVPLRAPGPVTIAISEVKGSALKFLFLDTLNVILRIAKANAVTTEEADQLSRKFLATLALEQALSLLPGKLGAVVALWQSQTLFRASAASVSGRHWGEALSEFSAALGVLASAREQALEELILDGERPSTMPEEQLDTPAFSWNGGVLSAEQQLRLQALEAKNVALDELRHDELLSLYVDGRSGNCFAAVRGRVYQVRQTASEDRWMIVGADGTPGPRLRLDDNQRWELDLSLGLKGGGGMLTTLRNETIDAEIEESLVIKATGMPEIRQHFRDHARRIGRAHLQAKQYLENCLDNLHVHQRNEPLDDRAARIIGHFFGVDRPDTSLLIDVERSVKSVFDALMDSTLSPYSSPRYVIGDNRQPGDMTSAFVIKSDVRQRIFLTERFFNVPSYSLNPLATAEGFELGAHYRAATLIHELTHLANDTHDIMYLETSTPYPDLLLADTEDNALLKAEVESLQREGLSHLSRRSDLFLTLEEGQWRDLSREDGKGKSAILRITGKKTLDEARDVFLSDAIKRREILLKNADSVTLLVLSLGRRNFVMPNP
ncbi:dermonecrotic toxin domain-containing protein [Pseudomonas abietaniphila]|uniref:dermonecrotic toxin domain-containing protein n=1 Tax=Pseudomonas abietaniphila TaxID=89065 RepID=UPI000782B0DA|nr:DUF6543 domain-containing protein [Pseudomonas abietaniphila]